ncbi:uncharacterized protein LOC112553036 [Pogonomyrmex barbatus]|uniref:Uncharacterized protein LOC112553036 n=1 Tax=Pogonomyrmex barbatus TaxID=144034 RepID=A0A8N1S9Y2_9HYME|nr:uncharacterized protein LOC112553036 [Pogonomyrmex barbatus]
MCVQHVRYDWSLLSDHNDICILIEYIKKSRIFTLAYIIFISMGATCYLTAPFTIRIIDILLASNVTRPKRLPNPSEYFLDLERYYYFLLAITYVGYYVCSVIVIATDTIYIALLQHACGILAILRYILLLYICSHRLENLPMSNKSSNVDYNFIPKWDTNIKDIIQCVQLQIRVERLIQLIESTFAICLFTDIGFGILFQCSSCVMIVTNVNTMYLIKNCPLLAMQSIRLFFNSWIGQRIIDHSSQISFAAYNGIWYQMSLEARKMLLFLIMKCRKPYHITMAKLYIISMEGYSMLMRTSASYITLMISLNTNDA